MPPQVQELIESSGNTFHAKVARWFTDHGWSISVSPYYMDQSQQKARELDLVVEKVSEIRNSFGEWKGRVAVRLFVECKFLPGHSVFWFMQKDKPAIEQMLCAARMFRERNTHTGEHHYLSSGDRVAKLFTSSATRGQEADPFYKALNQSLNALVSLRRHPARAFSSGRQQGGFQITLDFPVVVCSSFSQMYGADFAGGSNTEIVTENFQLEVQYAYIDASGGSRDELFLIDFVEYDRLSDLVAALDKDARLAGFFANDD
jgi:hypothetical protein